MTFVGALRAALAERNNPNKEHRSNANQIGGSPLQKFVARGARRGTLKSCLLVGCALGTSLALAGVAVAQDADGAAPSDSITVTGSRIQRTGMVTPTPVTTVTAQDLEMMAPGALIEVFDKLPQFLGNSTPDTAGNFAGSAGSSNLNMRGLESKRTLVLLDGRRMVSTNRLGTVDIGVFPESMIERVEVVTGGASAAYGTDAVAGVTNFILNTDFEGLSAHAQAGITERNDNENAEFSVSMGRQLGDKAHILGSFEYYTAAEVPSYVGRDWYEGWGIVTNPTWRSDGTGTGPQYITAPNVVSTKSTLGGMFTVCPGACSVATTPSALDYVYFRDDGTPANFVFSDLAAIDLRGTPGTNPNYGRSYGSFSQSITNGGSGDNIRADANRRAEGSVAPEVERTSTFLYGDYDVTPNFNVYAQGIYGTNRVLLRGGSTVFEDGWSGTIYSGNPFLPASIQQVLDDEGRASIPFSRTHSSADIGLGAMQQTNRTLSLTTGFTYDIDSSGFFDGWNVGGYYQRGENNAKIRLHDFVRVDRLYFALDAVVDPNTGATVCNVALQNPGNAAYSNCVPINLFGAGRASDDAVDYVLGRGEADKVIFADVTQDVAELTTSGEVFDGFGAGPVSVALGASYRKDALDQYVEPAGLVFGTSVPAANNPAIGIRGIGPSHLGRPVHQFTTATNIAGSYDVTEFFGETLIPLLADRPLFERLETNVSARWADYSGSGGIWAWKAGLDWQIYSDLRLRATSSRDVRAGTLSERFDRQGQGATARDPENNNAIYAFSQTIGGNPNIAPEEADTITVGAVYQPSFVDGFGISVDYYDIKLAGAIGQLGVQRIIDDCFAGAADLCQYVQRNPDGTLFFVENIFLNIAEQRVSGWDIEASYRTDVSLLGGDESMRFRGLMSLLTENSTTNPGAPKRDSAGVGNLFETALTANATYMNGPWSLFLQGQYLGEQIRNVTWVEGVDIDDNTVDSIVYTDLGLTYSMDKDNGSNWEFFGNVRNLFDKEPPLSPTFTSGFSGAVQTNEGAYDLLGRRFTAGVRVRY